MKRSKASLSAASDLLSVSDMWADISPNLDFVGSSSPSLPNFNLEIKARWTIKSEYLLIGEVKCV